VTQTLVPIRSIAIAIHMLLWPALALAQSTATAQTPARVRGSIEAMSGSEMTVKTREGDTMKIALAPNLAVGTVRRAALADIKPGDFVGSAAMKGRDGKLHALEVHIFPEAMRGTGEGQRPWDSGPDSSMTNATVGEVAASPEGNVLKLTYKGGTAEIVVDPNTPIVTLAPGDASMLMPGRAVMLFVVPDAAGKPTAARVTVESGGVKPPM
jgi:hypothetical protein